MVVTLVFNELKPRGMKQNQRPWSFTVDYEQVFLHGVKVFFVG